MADPLPTPSSAERLRQLSNEVGRIATLLARLSGDSAVASISDVEPLPNINPETVRSVLAARRLRARFIPDVEFADPAWDMLLELLLAEINQFRTTVTDLSMGAGVPASTGLRWLKLLTKSGLVVRIPDPDDGRRVFVELTPQASQALHKYFAAVSDPTLV